MKYRYLQNRLFLNLNVANQAVVSKGLFGYDIHQKIREIFSAFRNNLLYENFFYQKSIKFK